PTPRYSSRREHPTGSRPARASRGRRGSHQTRPSGGATRAPRRAGPWRPNHLNRKEDPPMKHNLVVASALAAALSMPLLTFAQGGRAPIPKFEHEKCYGVAKAGKTDCQTANSSCAGTSKANAQKDAWVYVPKGTCDRLVNGSLQPKA